MNDEIFQQIQKIKKQQNNKKNDDVKKLSKLVNELYKQQKNIPNDGPMEGDIRKNEE